MRHTLVFWVIVFSLFAVKLRTLPLAVNVVFPRPASDMIASLAAPDDIVASTAVDGQTIGRIACIDEVISGELELDSMGRHHTGFARVVHSILGGIAVHQQR